MDMFSLFFLFWHILFSKKKKQGGETKERKQTVWRVSCDITSNARSVFFHTMNITHKQIDEALQVYLFFA
jgi:hypothetical protein